jgi:hypothetical protein
VPLRFNPNPPQVGDGFLTADFGVHDAFSTYFF